MAKRNNASLRLLFIPAVLPHSGVIRREGGFTLIELSIVLAIIGLIVGSVLVGRDLIKAAEIRKTISQKESFDVAVNIFQAKYNCLPGDCRGYQFGLGVGITQGNGNGMIGGVNVTTNGDEYKLFWRHLYEAKLIQMQQEPGTLWYGQGPTILGYHSPTCPLCRQWSYTYGGNTAQAGGWGVQQLQNYTALNCGFDNRGGSWTSFGGQLPSWNAFLIDGGGGVHGGGGTPGQLTAAEAYAIDAKVDDGKPLTGSVLARHPFGYSDSACSGNTELGALHAACNIGGGGGSNEYVLMNNPPWPGIGPDTPACHLIIRASW